MNVPQSITHELAARAQARGWQVEAAVRGVAGGMTLASLALAIFVDRHWLWLTAFVGVNLLQSSLTGWCLMSNLIALGRRTRGAR